MADFSFWQSLSQYYMEEGKLKWFYVGANSTLPWKRLSYEEIVPHYDDWDAWLERHNDFNAYQTCGMWSWMVTQHVILSSVFTSIGACLGLAWLILCLATTNWIIATLSLICIVVILFVFAAMLVLLGWELGIFEAVGLIVVVGLSVDYSVHIGHSYNECRFTGGGEVTRWDKTKHAMTEMGVSVVSGAATTFLASVFLLPASFMFYHVFGIFMLITVVSSLTVALTLFPALLYVCGPVGNCGDILLMRKCGRFIRAKLGCCNKQRDAGS